MTYDHGKKFSGNYVTNPKVTIRDDGKIIEMIYKDCCQPYNRFDRLVRSQDAVRLAEYPGYLRVQLPNGKELSARAFKNDEDEEVRIYFIRR